MRKIIEKEEIEDMLLAFYYKDENKKEAENAFSKLYRIYSSYILVVVQEVKKAQSFNFYDDIVDAVVTNTFLTFYEKFENFNIDEKDSSRDVNYKLKAYLSKIAKNELFDLMKKSYFESEHELSLDNDEFNNEAIDIELDEKVEDSLYVKMLKEILNTFKERDRAILLSLYDHYQNGKKSPKELREWLCKVHNTTEDNIRKVKSRCEKKIVAFFEQETELKSLK